LQGWNFEINPYDRCVTNKLINDHQFTTVCHTHGKSQEIHEYVGINIDFIVHSKAVNDIAKYVDDMKKEVPQDVKCGVLGRNQTHKV
jgi:hypothetical protein